MTSSAASDTDRARKRTGAPAGVVIPREPLITSTAAVAVAAGQVHVQQHHVRPGPRDHVHRGVDVRGLADDLQRRVQLGLDPRPEHAVVVHEDEADRVGHGRAPCGSVGGGRRPGRPGRGRRASDGATSPVERRCVRGSRSPRRPGRLGPRRPRRQAVRASAPRPRASAALRDLGRSAASGRGRSGRAGHRQGQGDLGAVVQPAQPRGAAVALHPADDRLADAEPVRGHGVDVEAGPVVADVRLDHLRARPRRRPRPAARRAARR